MAIEERDLSIEEAKAKAWINDVNHEIIQVETILANVAHEIENVVDDDDPIMIGIEKWGKQIDETWKNMIKEFKTSMGKVEETVHNIIEGFKKAVSDVESHK